MIQSRRHSLIECVTNIVVGYLAAVLSQVVIFPFFDIHIPPSDHILIGLWFTAISLARSYAIRRLFTRRTER